jgi:hypothetical protein
MTLSKELNERSPLRILERSIHGGLGEGKIGVVCSGPGVGKSAFLVGVALDYLMRGKQVLHISIDHSLDRIRNYYDEIFTELVNAENLEDAAEVRVLIERNRRIHTFREGAFDIPSLQKSMEFMRDHADMHPALMVVDRYDWDGTTDDDMARLQSLAREFEAEMWISVPSPQGWEAKDAHDYPDSIARVEKWIDVVLQLKTEDGTVHVNLLKDHDNPEPTSTGLDLDPTRLLIVRG